MDEAKTKKSRISPSATFTVCPLCDEKICVGKDNCPQIARYLKRKEQEIRRAKGGNDHVR